MLNAVMGTLKPYRLCLCMQLPKVNLFDLSERPFSHVTKNLLNSGPRDPIAERSHLILKLFHEYSCRVNLVHFVMAFCLSMEIWLLGL